jgi:hypothetical protein
VGAVAAGMARQDFDLQRFPSDSAQASAQETRVEEALLLK